MKMALFIILCLFQIEVQSQVATFPFATYSSPFYCLNCCGLPPCCTACKFPLPVESPILCLTCCGPPPCCNDCGLPAPSSPPSQSPIPDACQITCCGASPCCNVCTPTRRPQRSPKFLF